jgi:hypothetical protein
MVLLCFWLQVVYKAVSIWRFLFYCDMSSGYGSPQKSPDFAPEKKEIRHLTIFRQKKRF